MTILGLVLWIQREETSDQCKDFGEVNCDSKKRYICICMFSVWLGSLFHQNVKMKNFVQSMWLWTCFDLFCSFEEASLAVLISHLFLLPKTPCNLEKKTWFFAVNSKVSNCTILTTGLHWRSKVPTMSWTKLWPQISFLPPKLPIMSSSYVLLSLNTQPQTLMSLNGLILAHYVGCMMWLAWHLTQHNEQGLDHSIVQTWKKV